MYLNLVNKKKFDVDSLSYDVKCLSSMTFPKLDIFSSTSSDTGSAIVTGSSTTTGDLKLNGNVVDTSNPVYTGEKYNLTDEELRYLAYVASREQSSVEGTKMELSLMVNLYQKNKGSYSSVYDYVCNSGWFGSGSVNNYSYPGDDYYNVAKEVLNGENRYLPSNVVEYDCIPDLTSMSTGSVSDTSAYIPGQTIINTCYGASYVFVGFAPNGGDPFGYLV